jgi:hypothetical protein
MDGSSSVDGCRIPDVQWDKNDKVLPTYGSSSKNGKLYHKLTDYLCILLWFSDRILLVRRP